MLNDKISLKNIATPILSKFILAFCGFLNLIIVIDLLDVDSFNKLIFIQTFVFVIVTIFDTGHTQACLYQIVHAKKWKEKFAELQLNRALIFLILGGFLAAFFLLYKHYSINMIAASLLMFFSFSMNIDWALNARQDRNFITAKNFTFGLANIFLTVTFLKISPIAESVLYAIFFSNSIVYLIYLNLKKLTFVKKIEIQPFNYYKNIINLSIANTANALAYNLPILFLGHGYTQNLTSIFTGLYRLFSLTILFVEPVLEFNLRSDLLKAKKSSSSNHGKSHIIFFKYAFLSLLLTSPVLFLNNNFLFNLFNALIHLKKFSINPEDLTHVKIIIFLFCVEYSYMKYLFINNFNRIIMKSSCFAFLFSLAYFLFLILFNKIDVPHLFYSIFIYQTLKIISSFLLLKLYEK